MKLILTFLVLSISLNVWSFKFTPMSQTLDPSKEKNAVFYIENDTKEPIAVQLTAAKRVMDLNGVETQPEEKENLSIYPDQLIVPPGEKRSVKVNWLKSGKLEVEDAYRIIAEQLPIEIDGKKKKAANIKVLLRYVAAFYVSQNDFDSKVEISSVNLLKDSVKFTVRNSGTKHQVLTKLTLSFKVNNKLVEVLPEELKGMAGENVLANSTREFTVPLIEKFKFLKSDQKVVMNFEKE